MSAHWRFRPLRTYEQDLLAQATLGNVNWSGPRFLSLSVETGNPARSLYERFGFAPAGPEFDAGALVLRF